MSYHYLKLEPEQTTNLNHPAKSFLKHQQVYAVYNDTFESPGYVYQNAYPNPNGTKSKYGWSAYFYTGVIEKKKETDSEFDTREQATIALFEYYHGYPYDLFICEELPEVLSYRKIFYAQLPNLITEGIGIFTVSLSNYGEAIGMYNEMIENMLNKAGTKLGKISLPPEIQALVTELPILIIKSK